MRSPSTRQWIMSACPDIGKNHDRPQPMRFEAMHVGNNVVHVSHNMFMYKQLLYCNTCGFRGSTSLRKLAYPCDKPTSAGLRALKQLKSGRLPTSGAKQWPVDRLEPKVAAQAAALRKGKLRKSRAVGPISVEVEPEIDAVASVSVPVPSQDNTISPSADSATAASSHQAPPQPQIIVGNHVNPFDDPDADVVFEDESEADDEMY